MWIEISDSVPTTHPTPPLGVVSILEQVASASFRGWHVLDASRPCLLWMNGLGFSMIALAAIKRAIAQIAEKRSIKSRIETRICLEGPSGIFYQSNEGIWHVSLDAFDAAAFTPSELLAEDLRDARVFEISARHYQQHKGLKGSSISLWPGHGGGNGIVPCFHATIQNRTKFVLAVTDSDRDHPEALASATSTACRKLAEKQEWIAAHYELGCREIENLLPIHLVEDSIEAIAGGSPELVGRVKVCSEVAAKNIEAHQFADLKLGTRGWHATASDTNEKRRSFWSSAAKGILGRDAVCTDECAYGSHACTCTFMPALGARTVEHFEEHCQKLSLPKQLERVKTSINAEGWLDVGRAAFMWGVADPRQRV
jgi:hypothetical protein